MGGDTGEIFLSELKYVMGFRSTVTVLEVHLCYGLAVIFCGFISHLISRKTINSPEIFYGHGCTGRL